MESARYLGIVPNIPGPQSQKNAKRRMEAAPSIKYAAAIVPSAAIP
jgi:hypothetical protein